jgi:hypothetical protein
LIGSSSSHLIGQSPGGGGGHGTNEHNDSLITAYFGYDKDVNDYTQEVPGEWEAYQDSASGEWWNQSRMYGAFVVANLNDSDGNQVVDKDDLEYTVNLDQEVSYHSEPDLIKLVIHITEWNEHYQCFVEPRKTDFYAGGGAGSSSGGGSGTQSGLVGSEPSPGGGTPPGGHDPFNPNAPYTVTPDIKFYKSATKAPLTNMAGVVPVPGTNGFKITGPGQYTVYVEVSAASTHPSDYTIHLEFRQPTIPTNKGQWDRVNITLVWATKHKFVNQREETTIVHVAPGNDVIYYQPPNADPRLPLPLGLEVGDYIVIYDDNFVQTPPEPTLGIYPSNRYEPNTQFDERRNARKWIFARINSIENDGGLRLDYINPQNDKHGSKDLVSTYDRFAYVLNKHVKPNEPGTSLLPSSFCYAAAGVIGSNQRKLPLWRNGMELVSAATPLKVMTKPMSSGR